MSYHRIGMVALLLAVCIPGYAAFKNDAAPQNAERVRLINEAVRGVLVSGQPLNADQLYDLLLERRNILRGLSARAPEIVRSLVFDDSILASLPRAVDDLVEKRTEQCGRIENVAVDDIDKKTSGLLTFLVSGEKRTHLLSGPDVSMMPYSNSTVLVRGMRFESYLIVQSVTQIQQVMSPSATQGPFNALFLLVTYPSAPPVPFSPEVFAGWILQDTSAVRRFFRENSYGKAELTGDAYGWFTLPDSTIDTLGWVMPDLIALSQIVASRGIDLSKYDNVVWIQNLPPGTWFGSGLGQSGRGPQLVGGKYYTFGQTWIRNLSRTWINSGNSVTLPPTCDQLICHEFGHTMTLNHADVWTGSPSDDWTVPDKRQNATNPFDVMSYMSNMGRAFHFNALYKRHLGWLDSSSTIFVRSSGEYFVRPLESTGGIRAAEIRSADTSRVSIVVEFRRPIGFDANIVPWGIDGPMVNTSWGFLGYRVEDHPSWTPESILLMDKSYALPYTVKSAWTIMRAGVTIGPVLSVSDSGVTFKVTISGQTTSTDEPTRSIPSAFALSQNYPNPFNPSTTIRYGLPARSHVNLTVFNTLGQQVTVLQHGEQEAGYHEVKFDGLHLPSAVYFYRIQAGTFTETKRLLLLR